MIKDTAAIIDLDSTLSDLHLWQALFAYRRKNRFNRDALYAFIAFHTPLWLLYEAISFPGNTFTG